MNLDDNLLVVNPGKNMLAFAECRLTNEIDKENKIQNERILKKFFVSFSFWNFRGTPTALTLLKLKTKTMSKD
jgi:hypothetical protein